ncbi:MAG: S8 family serine peptidase [Phycisphaerae bacterium]|nr:S8 family serine peptidase [Phycisphaerae bacterium]
MRKRWVMCGFGAFLVMAAGVASAGQIDADLQRILENTPPEEIVSVMVFLEDRVDLTELEAELSQQRATLQTRHETVVRALQEKAQATQQGLRDHFKGLERAGRIEKMEAFWIANFFRVDLPAGEVAQLAQQRDVGKIYFNYDIELIRPVRTVENTPSPRTPEPGLVAIRAPEVWAMGITGANVMVSTLDTGVDGNHPCLASRWAGLRPEYAGHPEWAFFDPVTGWTFPQDSGSHGTHTMGTICGGAPGDEVGVAPGAYWIHAAVIDRVSLMQTCTDAILAFQWLIDPDGNPGTNWDVPAVCSNSWGIGSWHNVPPFNTPCDPSFWSYLDACEAAGIVILFSAGNEGSGPDTLRRPADRATDEYRTCAVGAVDGNTAGYPIAGFSSRGPSYCTPDGTPAIKPEVSAPGVYVRSSIPGNSYNYYDGTSMASPHVNGVVALMREACPDLLPVDIKQILYDTAVDLGTTGNDNDYGYGMIDAFEAVLAAQGMCGPHPPRAFDGYFETPVDTPATVELVARDYDEAPFPIVYEIVTLPASGHTLTDVGNGHVIDVGELPYALVNNGNQVIYTPIGGFYGNDTFTFWATDGGVPPDGGYSEIATVTGLVLFDPPTISTPTLPIGCPTESYGLFFLLADQGQPALSWALITDEYLEVDLGSNQFATVGTAQGWHADDNYWSYNLPFTFTFFGQPYTTCWLTSNGFIDFDGGSSNWSNSDSELIAATRICPLWDDLRTDQGGDIYIDAGTPGQVTFRWDTVTYSGSNQCNHSCTLYSDGTIRFNYGSGNNPITPTIGISAGDGTNYLLSTYNNANNLDWANSHDFVQSVPLPNGMWLHADGELGGTPTDLGTFVPRFRVTDSLARFDIKQLTLVIQATCPPICRGDCNCDGFISWRDIDHFVAAINNNQGDWEDMFLPGTPTCYFASCDVNSDGAVNWRDIDPLVDVMNTTCP